MADTQCSIFQCFRGEHYPLSIFREYKFIDTKEEEKVAKIQKSMIGSAGIPFFQWDHPGVFVPFSILKSMGYMRHFHEFRMFQIMDALYFPMRMKVLQSHTTDLTNLAQLCHWQRLSRSLDRKCKTSIGDKELSAVFAVSQCLKNIRWYLETKPNSVNKEKLSAEYEFISAEFEKQMIGLPEYYYLDVLVDYPKLCAHSDRDFSDKSVDFILSTVSCFDVERKIPSTELTEAEKDERIINLAHLAKRALFFNPCFTNTSRIKIFDPSFDFPKRIKRAYHEREKERLIQSMKNEGRGPHGG